MAGQIEYWATLGRIADETGLTVQEAWEAIARYDARLRGGPTTEPGDALDAIEARFVATEADGRLAQAVRQTVAQQASQTVNARRAAWHPWRVSRPVFYVLAGPNGAGKSTLYRSAVAERPIPAEAEFVNADPMLLYDTSSPAGSPVQPPRLVARCRFRASGVAG